MTAPNLKIFYFLPAEKYVFSHNDQWDLNQCVSEKSLSNLLRGAGYDKDQAKQFIKNEAWGVAHGADVFPGKPSVVHNTTTGQTYLNLWEKPTITPKPGTFPLIDEVLTWLTDDPSAEHLDDIEGFEGTHDPAMGKKWLLNMLAAKIQNPAFLSKVGMLFVTSQGGGKGLLFRAIMEMLGPKNCAVIGQGALENKFNARWVGKLAVLGDEVKANDRTKDIADLLKQLIDAKDIEKEGKGTNQTTQRNRIMWVFASNDTGTPLKLERTDRRVSVFTNVKPIPAEYRKRMNSAFKPEDRSTLQDWFKDEIAAFMQYLLGFDVDYELISKPANTLSRWRLINANAPSHETFMQTVNHEGIDGLLDEVLDEYSYNSTREDWDAGDKGISVKMLYKCYYKHCRNSGNSRPMSTARLSSVLQNESGWRYYKASFPSGKRGYAFVVPRKA